MEKISQQLQSHLEHEKTIFLHKGFNILQNIDDRITLEKEIKQAKDLIFLTTKNEKPDTKLQQEKWQKESNGERHSTNGFKFKVSDSIFTVERSN